ncbi:uncharacterized protein LOC141695959 [Apium graveolens]|uniref:uncharacterized protein LOC141695959 n=1 Tax=Apium graveolens TaxID=4045 RepID=UPI003D790475
MHNFEIGDERLECLTLYDVHLQLRKTGGTLRDFLTLPKLDHDLQRQSQHTLLYEENMYDRNALSIEGRKCRGMLNEKQSHIFETIVGNVRLKKVVYFLFTVMEGGRTAHSRFKIPIDVNENSTCNIPQQSYLAELIIQTDLVIWDEAPMNYKYIFEAVNRSFRDLIRHIDVSNLEKPFGGKTVLLGGDFKQVLRVLPKKGREDIVMASINKSYLWDHCTVFRLEKNMCIESGVPEVTILGQKIPYADWVIVVGNGQVPTISSIEGNKPYWIEIPPELYVEPNEDGKEVVIDKIYSNLHKRSNGPDYFKDRAILTPLNDDVNLINKEVLKQFPGHTIL